MLRSRKAHFTVGEIAHLFEERGGLAQVLFVLTLPVLLPLPPGASMILALPLLLVAPQMMVGRKRLWLPDWLAEKTLERRAFAGLVHRILKPLRRVEAWGHPRLRFLTGPIGARAAGVAAILIAVVLVLPIPFANLLPALALVLLTLGLTRRDGLMVLGGYGLMAAEAAIIVLGAHGLRLLFHRLVAMA